MKLLQYMNFFYSHIFLFFLFLSHFSIGLLAYDIPDLYKNDRFLRQKVRDYNYKTLEIHNAFPIPLPFYGAPPFYAMERIRKNAEEEKFLKDCKKELSQKKSDTSYPSKDYICSKKLNEWKSQVDERRTFHREFCKDGEELAYLDYLVFINPILDPYERCKTLRDNDSLEKDKDKLREEISNIMKPLPLPMDNLHPPNLKDMDKTHIQEWKKDLEVSMIRVGVLDIYSLHYPHDEWDGFRDSSWDEFIPSNKYLKHYEELSFKSKEKFHLYMHSEMDRNDESKNSQRLKELLRFSKEIINFPEWQESDKKTLQQTEDCLIKLFQKNPGMNPGFYLGFFRKYGKRFLTDSKPNHSTKDKLYENNLVKLRKLHWKKNQGSELFQKRLEFVNSSCLMAAKKDEKKLNLKYFLSLP